MKRNIYIILFTLLIMNGVKLYSQNKTLVKQSNYDDFLPMGKFEIGANYWASHAGPNMWSDWRPDIVEQDLKKMSEAGITLIRVFPTWTDFQPLDLLIETNGVLREYRINGKNLSDDDIGKAGVSETAINRFEEFIDLAEKYNIKLIIGLITGHMSGENFVPEPFEHMNPISNPEAVKWQVRFINYFVSRFKDREPIVAWDLGNEVCYLAYDSPQAAAWLYVSHITKTIKAIDPDRPVLTGMPSVSPVDGPWNMQDLAELTDFGTVHFYHTFMPYSEYEPLNTIRPILGPIILNIETVGIGGKPSIIEEYGTLGPTFAHDGADGIKPGYIRSSLFSAWAHDCRAILWWIAFDQGHLTDTPYDWNARGSEYGLWYPDGSPKPIFKEIQKFSEFSSKFKHYPLPERIIDGICILTDRQDTWGTAYSSFILAKQAGIDIDFQHATQSIKDADIYFLPGVNTSGSIRLHKMRELLERVKAGSILYISNDDGQFGPNFTDFTGLKIQSYTRGSFNDTITINETNTRLEIHTDKKNIIKAENAKVLAYDQDGNPAFTCNDYGKGKILFLNYPLEKLLAEKFGAFNEDNIKPYWEIYKQVKQSAPSLKVFINNNGKVGFTEHIVDNNTRVIIAINYFPSNEVVNIELKEGWKVSKTLYGKTIRDKIELPPNDASVFSIVRK